MELCNYAAIGKNLSLVINLPWIDVWDYNQD